MRVLGVAALAALVLGGCTSVKMVQRDGCWVRETKKTFHGTKEDLGPCSRAQPQWVEDRLTRLVQECIAQADYRWQVRALEAWNRREPLPAQDSQQTVIETCMNEAAGGAVTQNETLRTRLAELTTDREALRTDAARNEDHLRTTNGKLAEFLGEAAKRPPPVATATASATSDGTATNESGVQSETGSASQTLPAAAHDSPLGRALTKARAPLKQAPTRAARQARCEAPRAEPSGGPTSPALAGTAAQPAPAASPVTPAAGDGAGGTR